MVRTSRVAVGFIAIGAIVATLGCGRTEIDGGFGVTNVTAGTAGTAVPIDGGGNNGATAGTGTKGAGGNTGGAGGTGSAQGGSSGGAAGGSHAGAPIPCGNGSCIPGLEICCVQQSRRGNSESCIKATDTCQGGASVGCIDKSSCGSDQICCESLLMPSTQCTVSDACFRMPGVILCGADAECPAIAPHCCLTESGGICAAQACPAGSGG
jgi:hypothetical protein